MIGRGAPYWGRVWRAKSSDPTNAAPSRQLAVRIPVSRLKQQAELLGSRTIERRQLGGLGGFIGGSA